MNKKGLYSGGIALATIVLVIAISFNITSAVQAEESQGNADAIIDAKWEAQNMGRLYEEIVVDAMVDQIFVSCDYDDMLIESRIINYFSTYNPNQTGCTASIIDITGDADSTLIEFNLVCNTIAAPGLITNYNKTILLDKKATITGSTDTCNIEITDNTLNPFGYELTIQDYS